MFMQDRLPLSDSISPIQTLVVVVAVVVVDLAAVVVAPFIRFNITLYSNTCQSNRCLHFVQTFHSIKRRHTQIMIRFLLLVFLALDGGAFGDTQVFDILNNLWIKFWALLSSWSTFCARSWQIFSKKHIFRTGLELGIYRRTLVIWDPSAKLVPGWSKTWTR